MTRLPRWLRWLAALSLVRLIVAAALPVLTDEAYHWNFARHLDWGYYDHPPMIAWAIAAGRLLFGDTSMGVRFLPLLFSIGTSAVLARLAFRLGGERAAEWTVLLGFAEPLLFGVSCSATPDSPMLFFWALAMSLSWDAIASGKAGIWIAAGAALGAAMLSKYSAVLLPASIFGYLLFSKKHRRVLASPWPYVAAILAALMFLPVIYWNSTHDWASFRFQIGRRLGEAGQQTSFSTPWFLLQQWAAFLPLIVPLAVAFVRDAVRSGRSEDRYLVWCFGLGFGAFFVLSFTRRINTNWPVPAYLSLAVGMAVAISRGDHAVARFYSGRGAMLAAATAGAYLLGAPLAAMRVPRIQPDLFAWTEVCRETEAMRSELGERGFVLGIGRHFVAPSQLAYHLRAPERVYAKNLLGEEGMQYDFWVDRKALAGRDAVVVIEEKDATKETLEKVRQRFRSLSPPRELRVRVPLPRAAELRFTLLRAEGYVPP